MNRTDLECTEALLDFLEASPVSFAAVKETARRLEEKGYRRLSFQTPWTLENGGRYYVTRFR